MKNAASACANSSLGNRFRGEILLQVQKHGEAWYVDPIKCRAIYMKDGAVAYEVMRFLGFGTFTRDIEKYKTEDLLVAVILTPPSLLQLNSLLQRQLQVSRAPNRPILDKWTFSILTHTYRRQ